jgi:cytochrome P450
VQLVLMTQGKNLAYMEMRLVLAAFVTRFDFNMEPSDAQEFRASIRDQFVTAAGTMMMQVSAR